MSSKQPNKFDKKSVAEKYNSDKLLEYLYDSDDD